ncbi:MAG: hypothetical protein ABSA65_03195 [Acidimicrobiales bacterium]|jgi:hypothetical protein
MMSPDERSRLTLGAVRRQPFWHLVQKLRFITHRIVTCSLAERVPAGIVDQGDTASGAQVTMERLAARCELATTEPDEQLAQIWGTITT